MAVGRNGPTVPADILEYSNGSRAAAMRGTTDKGVSVLDTPQPIPHWTGV